MRINTNISALNSFRNLSETNTAVASSMQKLSSGFRINRAADDAAGLGIANKLRSDIRSMTQANRNAEQANSVLQIAEGATGSIQKMLERMKELATQSGSDSVDADGRTRINEEFTNLKNEIQRTAETTKFQGKALLDNTFGNSVAAGSTALAGASVVNDVKIAGAAAGSYTLSNSAAGKLELTNGSVTQQVTLSASGKQTANFSQFGISVDLEAGYDNTTTGNTLGNVTVSQGSGGGSFLISASGDYNNDDVISLDAINFNTTGSGSLELDGDVSDVTNARTMMTTIDNAMKKVNTALGQIGAKQNRIENAMSNLKTSIQNFSAAESVIRDVDMAEEMTKFSKNNILAQAGQAMLAQANQSSQGVLQLLRG
jgi:flagellin